MVLPGRTLFHVRVVLFTELIPESDKLLIKQLSLVLPVAKQRIETLISLFTPGNIFSVTILFLQD